MKGTPIDIYITTEFPQIEPKGLITSDGSFVPFGTKSKDGKVDYHKNVIGAGDGGFVTGIFHHKYNSPKGNILHIKADCTFGMPFSNRCEGIRWELDDKEKKDRITVVNDKERNNAYIILFRRRIDGGTVVKERSIAQKMYHLSEVGNKSIYGQIGNYGDGYKYISMLIDADNSRAAYGFRRPKTEIRDIYLYDGQDKLLIGKGTVKTNDDNTKQLTNFSFSQD